ncbi:uncharacterized protein LOC100899566 [Galendromus occidentalis]|uniref:Uncharacterized protein LOC100899566 n=1 Tax=Galendromus occidentalis TaxID=34638 RepID=A0AAJ6QUZ9_9ACAR|nr:uncharacterized protein LOC100899566 [Galendromus occidentalis]
MQADDVVQLVSGRTQGAKKFIRPLMRKMISRLFTDEPSAPPFEEASETVAEEVREEADNESNAEAGQHGLCEKFCRAALVHIFFLLLILAITFNWSAAGSAVARKTCLSYNKSTDPFCVAWNKTSWNRTLSLDGMLTRHHRHKHQRSEAEDAAELYLFYQGLIAFVPPSILVLFLASCCDEFSTFKIPLLISITGSVVTTIANLVSSLYPKAPLFYDILTPLAETLCGGLPLALMCVYVHVAANVSRAKRTVTFFLLQVVFMFAFAVGRLVAILVVAQWHDCLPIFAIAIFFFGTCMLYSIFFVHDVVLDASEDEPREHRRHRGGHGARSDPVLLSTRLFSHHHLFSSVRGLVQQRVRGTRYELVFLIVVIFSLVATTRSSVSSFFLDADPDNAILDSVIIILTLLIVMPVFVLIVRMIPIDSNYTITFIGLLFLTIGQSLQFATNSPALGHVRQVLHTISNIAPAGIRAHVATLVEKKDLGKVYGVVAACESVAPLVGSVFRKFVGHGLGQLPFLVLTGGFVIFLGVSHFKDRRSDRAQLAA